MQIAEWDLELVRLGTESAKHGDDEDRMQNIEHSFETAHLMREDLVTRINSTLPDDGSGGASF